MEVAGFVLGVASAVGVLAQVFDGCLRAYSIYSTATNLGQDSERFVTRIKIEEARLYIWGETWGVLGGKLEESIAAHNGPYQECLRSTAELILTQLYQTIMDLQKLQERYGLREQSPGSVDKEAYKSSSKNPKTLLTNSTTGAKLKLRARWVIADKEKFSIFLEDLKYFNDRLMELFPTERAATIQRAWTNDLVQRAERVEDLQLLETASSGGLYPRLETFVQLKQLRINLNHQEPSRKILSSSELKIPLWRIELTVEDSPEGTGPKTDASVRTPAIYRRPTDKLEGESVSDAVDVFVEWTAYDTSVSLDERLQLYQRIDNLARMLHSSSNRHPDLHTLDCLGYVEDTPNSRYGLVYLCPVTFAKPLSSTSPMFHNLGSIIAENPIPDLNVRFKLAHTLAVALWSCHSLDWLHKTLCPHNVLFFYEASPPSYASITSRSNSGIVSPTSSRPSTPQKQRSNTATPTETPPPQIGPYSEQQGQLSKPYLCGFDSSRPDYLDEMTVASTNSVGQDLYRHPSSLGAFRLTYRKSFDIYSLGLLLLEIGLWKRLEQLNKGKKSSKYTPQVFRDKVVNLLVPTLGPKTGSVYKEVVEQCLTFDDSNDEKRSGGGGGKGKVEGTHQLMQWAVTMLGELRV